MRRKTLVDRLARNLARDPQDAPVVDVQGAVAAQELGWELDWADRQLSGPVQETVVVERVQPNGRPAPATR